MVKNRFTFHPVFNKLKKKPRDRCCKLHYLFLQENEVAFHLFFFGMIVNDVMGTSFLLTLKLTRKELISSENYLQNHT